MFHSCGLILASEAVVVVVRLRRLRRLGLL